MANEVTLSKGVRQNLLSLQNVAEMLTRTQERLATGKKVNSALDNPINFFTSAGLSARANDLSRLLDAVGNAVQTLQAADKGISAMTKLLESAQATANQAKSAAEGAPEYDLTVTGTEAFANDAAVAAVSDGNFTITLGNGASYTIVFDAGLDTLAELNAELAAASAALGDDVTVALNGADQIEITSTSPFSITISGTAQTLVDLGFDADTHDPTVTVAPSEARASLQADYNTLLQQITQMAGDSSFNGINLLNGDDLAVVFNEDGSSSLTIEGVDFSASGLGLTEASGDDFQTNAGIDAFIAELDAAIATLRTQAARFGSNMSIVQARQDFTKNMITVLQIGADQLVLADSNEEGANMLALNTRQQLSTVALSLAAQADQNVLRLF